MPNRLAHETSPYLLQHANNPVDWRPWDPEALELARREHKPIFLSIGYSACHWCHVMEHESFENGDIAAFLNEHFVAIKVDREERPDLDQIYMGAVQLMNNGRGGWPMSVFLTPELEPFFGGTYWPPEPRMGMPGFDQVLRAVHDAWRNRREQVLEQGQQVAERLRSFAPDQRAEEGLSAELLTGAVAALERSFDSIYGGFGRAPKFPHAIDLQLLLRAWRRNPRPGVLEMVVVTLDRMAQGGIYDHLGGGFARYSVDERWLTPHFEKMLYDNALLAGAYVDAYLVTGKPFYARVVRETLDYVLRDMTDPAGGFHSTEDADSEGEEGKFYVWTLDEVRELLGPERGDRFAAAYDVTGEGNFEGRNILNLPKSLAQFATLHGSDVAELTAELAESRRVLWEARERRVRPGKDDKVLVAWNGLMIDTLARAAGALEEPRYVAAARQAAEFLLAQVQDATGRLRHGWRLGQARGGAFLDDYACLANALVSLYEATFDERWVDEAVRLVDQMLAHFADKERGGFFYTADDHERLIARQKDTHDSSTPSGNAMAATVLLRLGRLCGRADYLTAASETLENAGQLMASSPLAAAQMLIALDWFLGPVSEIVIVGDPTQEPTATVVADLRRRYIPNRVVMCRATADNDDGSLNIDPAFIGKQASGGAPTVYLCERFACQAPISGVNSALERWLVLETAAREKFSNAGK